MCRRRTSCSCDCFPVRIKSFTLFGLWESAVMRKQFVAKNCRPQVTPVHVALRPTGKDNTGIPYPRQIFCFINDQSEFPPAYRQYNPHCAVARFQTTHFPPAPQAAPGSLAGEDDTAMCGLPISTVYGLTCRRAASLYHPIGHGREVRMVSFSPSMNWWLSTPYACTHMANPSVVVAGHNNC